MFRSRIGPDMKGNTHSLRSFGWRTLNVLNGLWPMSPGTVNWRLRSRVVHSFPQTCSVQTSKHADSPGFKHATTRTHDEGGFAKFSRCCERCRTARYDKPVFYVLRGQSGYVYTKYKTRTIVLLPRRDVRGNIERLFIMRQLLICLVGGLSMFIRYIIPKQSWCCPGLATSLVRVRVILVCGILG